MEKTPIYKNKKAIGVVLLLALALIAYFAKDKWMSFFQKKDAATNPNTATNTSTGSNTANNTTASTTIDKARVLRQGDSGASVKELQRLINTKLQPPLAKLVEDGQFGPKTHAALMEVAGVGEISINQFNAQFPTIPSVFTLPSIS